MQLAERQRELREEIPAGYSGWAHLAAIHAVILAAVGAVLAQVEAPSWGELAALPGFVLFANVFEWWVHRGPMHHLWRGLGALYERHARHHHLAFTSERMAFSSPRELRLVLFPPFMLPLMLLLAAPLPAALWWAGSRNLACLWLATVLGYYLLYEQLHTLHHWPPDSWLGRRGVVRILRRHHTRHHDLRRMARGNFNVSFPLADLLLGTVLKGDLPPPGQAGPSPDGPAVSAPAT